MTKQNQKTEKNGFTIIELLVIISIISILTGMSITGYRSYQAKSNLEMTIHEAKGLLSTALSLSLSPPEKDGNDVKGYGVEFDKTYIGKNKMTLFIDNNGNHSLDGPGSGNDKIIQEKPLSPGVSFDKFSKVEFNSTTKVTTEPEISGYKTTIIFELPTSEPEYPYRKKTLFDGCPNDTNCKDVIKGKIVFKRAGDEKTKTLLITTATNLVSVQ